MGKKKKQSNEDFIELDITEDDLGGSFENARGLWLGRFTPEQVVADLESHGIFEHLTRRGYTNIAPKIECVGFESALVITGEHGSKQGPQLLVEVRARITNYKSSVLTDDETYTSLVFDWILFQDPCAQFDADHPRLPGQNYPGLDLLHLGTKLMMEQVGQLEVDLIVNQPQHFHNAVFYSPPYQFIDPVSEGHFLALKRDLLATSTLAKVSRALDEGNVVDQAGVAVVWKQNAQAWPRYEAVEQKLFGEQYQRRVLEASLQKFQFAALNSPESL